MTTSIFETGGNVANASAAAFRTMAVSFASCIRWRRWFIDNGGRGQSNETAM
jgi:hypothetical protein